MKKSTKAVISFSAELTKTATSSENPDYQKFVAENSWWLSDYALFMAVKDHFGGVEWTKWQLGYQTPLEQCHGLLS